MEMAQRQALGRKSHEVLQERSGERRVGDVEERGVGDVEICRETP